MIFNQLGFNVDPHVLNRREKILVCSPTVERERFDLHSCLAGRETIFKGSNPPGRQRERDKERGTGRGVGKLMFDLQSTCISFDVIALNFCFSGNVWFDDDCEFVIERVYRFLDSCLLICESSFGRVLLP